MPQSSRPVGTPAPQTLPHPRETGSNPRESLLFIDHLTYSALPPIAAIAALVRLAVDTGHAASHAPHIGRAMQLIEEQTEQLQQLISLEASKQGCAYEPPSPSTSGDTATACQTTHSRFTRGSDAT